MSGLKKFNCHPLVSMLEHAVVCSKLLMLHDLKYQRDTKTNKWVRSVIERYTLLLISIVQCPFLRTLALRYICWHFSWMLYSGKAVDVARRHPQCVGGIVLLDTAIPHPMFFLIEKLLHKQVQQRRNEDNTAEATDTAGETTHLMEEWQFWTWLYVTILESLVQLRLWLCYDVPS